MGNFKFNNIMDFIATYMTESGFSILISLCILLIGYLVAKSAKKIATKQLRKSSLDDIVNTFMSNIIYIGILIFTLLAVLAKLGVATTSVIAALSAAGLAIGLALQGGLSNLAAGVLIIILRPFSKGEYIETVGGSGVVETIDLLTTTIITLDNKIITIPNAILTSNAMINYTSAGTRRVDLVYGVGYESDIDNVKKVIQSVLSEDKRILKDPASSVGLLELADNSLNFAVRPWVKAEDYWGVFFDTNEKIKKRFDAENISIPFPQRDVHIVSDVNKI